jgi:hypothetical protein
MYLVAVIDAMLARTLADSRTRPKWLTAGDPIADAKYRLATGLAAPILMVIISALAAFMHFNPGVIGRTACGLIGGGAFGVTNIGAYIYLGTRIVRRHNPGIHSNAPLPTPNAVLSAQVLCWACIPGYCIAMLFAALSIT